MENKVNPTDQTKFQLKFEGKIPFYERRNFAKHENREVLT